MPRLHLALAGALTAVVVACTGGGGRTDSAPAPAPAPAPYTEADVHFMAGMIVHHAQAVLIAEWAPSHGASPAIRTVCERILVSQRDEIAFMQRWLAERGERVPEADPSGLEMPGTDHPMTMPGMLTPAQLTELDAAHGAEFDRLFLTYMIQHHRGAVVMVEDLFSRPGAAQDGEVFRFAADVSADQLAEIDRMRRMLDAMSSAEERP